MYKKDGKFVYELGVDFFDVTEHGSPALTLSPEDLGENESGWTIKGQIIEDYFEWVNYFEASHPRYGKISGDFEDEVVADSELAFSHFWLHHPPTPWDYREI